MQIAHIVNSFVTNTFIMYLIANLMLNMFDQETSAKRKWLFSFITGTLFQTAYVYVIYFIGGAVSFSPFVYVLLVMPNPVFALCYCLIGVKLFRLSYYRSIKIMGYLYLFFLLILNFNMMIGPVFFAQTSEQYNYLLAMCKQICFFLTVLVPCLIIRYKVKEDKPLIIFLNKALIDGRKELILFLFKASFYYLLIVGLPVLVNSRVLAHFLITLTLVLCLGLNVYMDICVVQKSELENKDTYIRALLRSISEFSAIKHDFYNILQNYSGYLAIGDLQSLSKYHDSLLHLTVHAGTSIDLGWRMPENPPLISLLMRKNEEAERVNVKMSLFMQADLNDLHMDNVDLSRCLGCLLDNAIEAAAESEHKKVFFTIKTKECSNLIVITNSTASAVNVNEIMGKGFTSKDGHTGLGLYNVYKIIEKNHNCTFHINYRDFEFSAYIELRPPERVFFS